VIVSVVGAAPASGQESETPASPVPQQGTAPPGDEAAKQNAANLFQEGKAAQERRDFALALKKYTAAYAAFPDPDLLLTIGELYRLRGTETTAPTAFKADLEQAIQYFERYLETVPAGKSAKLDKQRAAAEQRIAALRQGIQEAEARQHDQEAEAQADVEREEALERRANEMRVGREQADEHGLQLGLDGQVTTGIATDLTGIGRIIAGGIASWGRYGVDLHLAFQGFLRFDENRGVSGRSISVIDVGPRIAFWNNSRSLGPFVAAGAGFGFFTGSPRERLVPPGIRGCPSVALGSAGGAACVLNLDKHVDLRVGLGWGFEVSEHATMVVRFDLVEWFYSVDGPEDPSSPPANPLEPQRALSFFFGLEFIRWK
jgi:hypothetical protein